MTQGKENNCCLVFRKKHHKKQNMDPLDTLSTVELHARYPEYLHKDDISIVVNMLQSTENRVRSRAVEAIYMLTIFSKGNVWDGTDIDNLFSVLEASARMVEKEDMHHLCMLAEVYAYTADKSGETRSDLDRLLVNVLRDCKDNECLVLRATHALAKVAGSANLITFGVAPILVDTLMLYPSNVMILGDATDMLYNTVMHTDACLPELMCTHMFKKLVKSYTYSRDDRILAILDAMSLSSCVHHLAEKEIFDIINSYICVSSDETLVLTLAGMLDVLKDTNKTTYVFGSPSQRLPDDVRKQVGQITAKFVMAS